MLIFKCYMFFKFYGGKYIIEYLRRKALKDYKSDMTNEVMENRFSKLEERQHLN